MGFGAMPGPRPPYHLPSLKQAARVYVCEGEKAPDAAAVLGLIATTSAGGSQAARKTDWSPLAGKEIVIVPDNDEPGEAYADDVVDLLSQLTPAPTVRVVRLPDLPDGGDMADYLELRGGDIETVKAAVEALVKQTRPEKLQPTRAKSLAFHPFPVDVLPGSLRKFVTRVSKALGCDHSFVVLPLLSALASAIGNTRVILLKHGWTEPAIVWTAIVGDPGTLKSPALDKKLWYLAAALAGLRKGDLQRLRWPDIDLEAGTIAITEGKAKRSDLIPIHPNLPSNSRASRL